MSRVLILCTGNSARSQMAEGLLKNLTKGRDMVYSAGIAPKGVHPLAIRAMSEINIDISHQKSQFVGEFLDQNFDYVITVCDQAQQSCPIFSGQGTRLHWSFPDPAVPQESEAAQYALFCQVRDQLKQQLITWLHSLA